MCNSLDLGVIYGLLCLHANPSSDSWADCDLVSHFIPSQLSNISEVNLTQIHLTNLILFPDRPLSLPLLLLECRPCYPLAHLLPSWEPSGFCLSPCKCITVRHLALLSSFVPFLPFVSSLLLLSPTPSPLTSSPPPSPFSSLLLATVLLVRKFQHLQDASASIPFDLLAQSLLSLSLCCYGAYLSLGRLRPLASSFDYATKTLESASAPQEFIKFANRGAALKALRRPNYGTSTLRSAS